MAALGFQAIANTVVSNLGVSFEWIILIIVLCANLILYAKDFKIGIITTMVTSGAVFIWFYEKGYNYVLPLSIFLMMVVILVLSLYAVNKSSATGGFT